MSSENEDITRAMHMFADALAESNERISGIVRDMAPTEVTLQDGADDLKARLTGASKLWQSLYWDAMAIEAENAKLRKAAYAARIVQRSYLSNSGVVQSLDINRLSNALAELDWIDMATDTQAEGESND